MSRMVSDRREAKAQGKADRTQPQFQPLLAEGTPPGLQEDFERAFADALRDILNHERRRAA
jgi:hypothetical protein